MAQSNTLQNDPLTKNLPHNSCAIAQFKGWNLDPAVAEIITPTCFNVFRNMDHFLMNNKFLRAAVNKFKNGAFHINGESLYLGLEDIFYITGLPVDGSPIVCEDFNPAKILEDMLGDDDPSREANSYYVKKDWLKLRFEGVREEDTQDEERRRKWLPRYARAYLLLLMGTVLFPENQKHTVFIGYLLFLADLTPGVLESFAWGAAVLAKLQDGFNCKNISKGPVWILEMFLLERIPLLRKEYLKISNYQETTSVQFPSVLHWSHLMKDVSKNMHFSPDWESFLDTVQSEPYPIDGNMPAAEISWRPYQRFGNGDQRIFYSHFPIFNMSIVNFHQPELSPEQLGIEEVNLDAIHKLRIKSKSKRGAASWDYKKKYSKAITFYNDQRYISVVQGSGVELPPPPPFPQRNDERNNERNEEGERPPPPPPSPDERNDERNEEGERPEQEEEEQGRNDERNNERNEEETSRYWERNYKQCEQRVVKLEKNLSETLRNEPVLAKVVEKAPFLRNPPAINLRPVSNGNLELVDENDHASPCAGSNAESTMVDTNGPAAAGPNSHVMGMACGNRMPTENQVVIEIDDSDDEKPKIETASASKTDKDFGRCYEKDPASQSISRGKRPLVCTPNNGDVGGVNGSIKNKKHKMDSPFPNKASENSDSSKDSITTKDMDELVSKVVKTKPFNYEVELLTAFNKDDELCLNAVCALHRVEKRDKLRCGSQYRGFSFIDATRGYQLAKFLVDGDPQGKLRKSVKELQQCDSKGIDKCRKLARNHLKQLYQIYQKEEDPFFKEYLVKNYPKKTVS